MRFQKCPQKKEKKAEIQFSSMTINQEENIRIQLLNVLFVKIPYIKNKYYWLEYEFDCHCVEMYQMSHYSLYIYDFKLCGKNKHNPRNISILQETQLTIRKSTLLRSIS